LHGCSQTLSDRVGKGISAQACANIQGFTELHNRLKQKVSISGKSQSMFNNKDRPGFTKCPKTLPLTQIIKYCGFVRLAELCQNAGYQIYYLSKCPPLKRQLNLKSLKTINDLSFFNRNH